MKDQLLKDPLILVLKKSLEKLCIPGYIVGGYVRDLLLGKKSPDIDFVIVGDLSRFSREIIKELKPERVKRSPFGTIKLEVSSRVLDIAVAREERYPEPGALPEVKRVYSIEKDLERRDFTINAMAVELWPEFGRFIDPFGGKRDLEAGLLEVIKDMSFKEDPTRAFRAVRYKVRLGLRYTEKTKREFENAKKFIRNVSFERIKAELKRIANEPLRLEMVKEIHRFGLLCAWHERFCLKELKLAGLEDFPFKGSTEEWIILFMPFLIEGEGELPELALTRKEMKIIEESFLLCRTERLKDIGEIHRKYKNFDDLSLLFCGHYKGFGELLEYVKKRKQAKPEIDGSFLKERGIRGKRIGEILEKIEILRLKGMIKTREEEIRWIEKEK